MGDHVIWYGKCYKSRWLTQWMLVHYMRFRTSFQSILLFWVSDRKNVNVNFTYHLRLDYYHYHNKHLRSSIQWQIYIYQCVHKIDIMSFSYLYSIGSKFLVCFWYGFYVSFIQFYWFLIGMHFIREKSYVLVDLIIKICFFVKNLL